jgi:primosomal protein N' (replication factor Y)
LFLPFSKLGLIVVDEEHETSFKQNDPAPRYHGRDAALQLAKLFDATVLLGSATPSLETVFQCEQGKFGRVLLTQRYLEQPLPAIEVVNLRSFAKVEGMPPVISPPLEAAIRQTLEQGLQVILFQNRRGFAHYLHCLSCQEVPQCIQCDVSLTYHKHDHHLRCHYCGYAIPAPHRCPSCGSEKLTLVGLGTERVEDQLVELFPGVAMERMDLDTTRHRDSYDQIIQRFSLGQTKILVGTQMLTKGLDFDHVGLVGIIRADVLTNYPDFRASERAWQLMSQVAGRAGRRGQQGKVILQTTQPNHPVLNHVIHYSWKAFFEEELAERKAFLFPPYVRLIRIELRSRSQSKVLAAAQDVAMALLPGFQGGILGPQPPLVNRIKDHYLQHLMIKLPRASKGGEWKHKAVETTLKILAEAPYNTVQAVFDVDPIY